jgi:methionine biosynthesis protein MetW
MKNFFYKLKLDLRQLFSYPEVVLRDHPAVDYDFYWAKRGRQGHAILSSWNRQRADVVLKTIADGDVVLDIGCGDGSILKYLMDRKKVKGIGVDMNVQVLGVARAVGIETHLVDLRDLEAVKSLPAADYVIGFEILEHVPEPELLVLTLNEKVRKGLFFSFPNTGYYAHRLRLLLGSFPLQWITHPAEHVRFWTVRDVRWWVKSLNLNLANLITYEGLPFLNTIFPSLFAQGLIIHLSKYRK